MLLDRIVDPPTLVMTGALAVYAVIVVRVAVRDAARARRRRAGADLRTLPPFRIAAAPRFGSAAHLGARGGGWRALQRHRIDRRRRRGERATW